MVGPDTMVSTLPSPPQVPYQPAVSLKQASPNNASPTPGGGGGPQELLVPPSTATDFGFSYYYPRLMFAGAKVLISHTQYKQPSFVMNAEIQTSLSLKLLIPTLPFLICLC